MSEKFEIINDKEEVVLTKYTGKDAEVVIPDGVTFILRNVFSGCKSLRSVSIPESVTIIGDLAFSDCYFLTNVTILGSVKIIGEYAFSDCRNLQKVFFHGNISSICRGAFEGCPKLKAIIDKDVIRSMNSLSAAYADFDFEYDDTDLAYISLFNTAKKWQAWILSHVTDADKNMGKMLDVFSGLDKKQRKKATKAFDWYVNTFISQISSENIDRIESMSDLQVREKAASRKKEADALIEYEAPLQQLIDNIEIDSDVIKAVTAGIPYAEKNLICSANILQYIISSYYDQYNNRAHTFRGFSGDVKVLRDGSLLKPVASADELAGYLNQSELRKYLTEKIASTKNLFVVPSPRYRLYLVAWARYAGDNDVKQITSYYKKWLHGKANEKYFAESIKESLLLSDTVSAARFFDSIGELKKYAKKRGMSETELRNSTMLPDFGFDDNGVKRYDIGGNTIEARVTNALTIELFDTAKQKVIRSFPKKSDDPDKAAACAKNFAEFKKQVTAFIKDFNLQLAKMYMSGESIGSDTWNKVYREHPIISKLNNYIIWQDSDNHTFAVIGGQIVDSADTLYTPVGKIRMAHVLDMEADDILRWQNLLREKKQALLIEQVWEPVRILYDDSIGSRYNSAVITSKDRNLLKSRLKRRGINVSAGEASRDYDHRAGKYLFDPENDLYFDQTASIHYTIDEQSGDLTLGVLSIKNASETRKLNAILLEIDKITISAQIMRDNAQAIDEDVLAELTISQITDFVKLAAENNAVNCTALLLDYKNKTYPDYDGMDEFVLDW